MSDDSLRKLFYDHGDVFDHSEERSFLRAYRDAAGVRGSLLLVFHQQPTNLCLWIANEDVDLERCEEAFRPGLPIVAVARAGVSVSCGAREKSLAGSAVVLETGNMAAFDPCPPGFRRLGPEDAPLFDALEDDYTENSMVAQGKESLAWPGMECFGVFADGALAAFMNTGKLRGLFADSYALANAFTAIPFRKKGYATALLRGVLQTHHGSRFFYTAQPATNTASVHLALKCGFVPIGETRCYRFE